MSADDRTEFGETLPDRGGWPEYLAPVAAAADAGRAPAPRVRLRTARPRVDFDDNAPAGAVFARRVRREAAP
jgi:hypothetical protein